MIYSNALFELGLEKDCVREYSRELEMIRQAISENPEYIELLFSPLISTEEKRSALEAAFSGVSDDVMSFIKLMCENGKIRDIHEEIQNFRRLEDSLEKILCVKIYTSVPLDNSQRELLIDKLKRKFKMKISPVFIIDKNIIGGIKLSVGDKLFDFSITQKLKSIKEMIS